MTKKYAASVYSQKSTTSAKSGRSYLSFTTGATIWPLFNTNSNSKNDKDTIASLDETKQSIWKNLKKTWISSSSSSGTNGNLVDNDSVTVKSSSGSISSSNSLGKWKKYLLVSPSHYLNRHREAMDTSKRSPVSLQDEDELEPTLTTSSVDSASLSDKTPSSSSHSIRTGILVNGGGSAQEIAEQKQRRKQRRLYLMRMQQQTPSHRQSIASSISADDTHRRHVGFSDRMTDSSSSSTLLSTPPDDATKLNDKLREDNNTATDVSWYSAPRVMFVEPSPVPRFRNEPPAPPPSPPYLNVIVRPLDENNQASKSKQHSLITDSQDSDVPTIFTTFPEQAHDHHHDDHSHRQHDDDQYEQRRPRLVFTSPLQRGQTITFSLQNAIPDDHIIVYKFLTSNNKLFPRQRYFRPSSLPSTKDTLNPSVSSSSWSSSTIMMSGTSTKSSTASSSASLSPLTPSSTNTERYFVRPSAGRMTAGESHSDIMLFLNQVPPLAPGEVLKDKILVRWALVQRGTQVETWVKQLKEGTRRKWLEMLLEKWPDQVVERKTRISIRFV